VDGDKKDFVKPQGSVRCWSYGSITVEGLRKNIEFLAKDGLLKEPLPSPEKYADVSYLKQAQNELGIK